MNAKMLKAIIIRLNEIKKGYQIDSNQGICVNLTDRVSADGSSSFIMRQFSNSNANPCRIYMAEDLIQRWLREQFYIWSDCHVNWPDGHKVLRYPVSGRKEYTKEQEQRTLWKNPKRLKLLDFLISQANSQLNARSNLLSSLIKRVTV